MPGGAQVGGNTAQNEDFVNAVYGNFPLMLGLIAIVTFLLLARAFRSVVLAAKAVMLNVVSLGASYGFLVLFWQQGHGSKLVYGVPPRGRSATSSRSSCSRSCSGSRWTTRSSSSPGCARSTTALSRPSRRSSARCRAPGGW